MSEAFIVRRGGSGGGTGATLTVNAPVGATVKITKDDKTKTKTVTANGTAVFAGITGGQWLASISDATHDETTPVPVEVITDYSVTLAFFSATINVTYPSGSTCTVSKDGVTLTAPDTSGTWACVVPEAGTWTVTVTDGSNTKSQAVEITTDGQSVAVELSYWHGELYDAGRTFDGVTGGWSTQKTSGSVTFDASSVTINCPQYGGAVMVTNNAIPFSGYTAIKLTLTKQPTTSNALFLSVVSSPTNLTNYANLVTNAKAKATVKSSTLNSSYEITLDVSAIDDGYIAFGGANAQTVSMSVKSILLI